MKKVSAILILAEPTADQGASVKESDKEGYLTATFFLRESLSIQGQVAKALTA